MSRLTKELESRIRSSVHNSKHADTSDIERIKGGDILWMQYREKVGSNRFKKFTGVCISKVKRGNDTVLVLRNTVGGVGVEYGFHSLSPNIKEIKQVRSKPKKGGRVKRYDLRQVK